MEKLLPVLSGQVTWQAIRGNALNVLAALPEESIDSFISDPPYGIGLNLNIGRSKARRSIRGDGRVEARELWRQFLPLAARAARPNSAHFFFGSWKSPWMHDELAAHFTVKYCAAWVKPLWGLGYYMRPRWEQMWLVHKGKPPIPAKADCDVWECGRDNQTDHPCRKPVPLMRRAIRAALPAEHRPGDRRPIVVDPFAGVFSTGLAALEEGCSFIGVELDRRYHRLGLARLSSLKL